MRFPIDVVFLDRQQRVVKVAENVRPFRASLSRGHAALELNVGVARSAGVQEGDRLVLEDRPGTVIEVKQPNAVRDKQETLV
jgi:uncharacterized membrane protein (UPF0127 family)